MSRLRGSRSAVVLGIAVVMVGGSAGRASAQKATPAGSNIWFSPYPMMPLGARVIVMSGDPAAPVATTIRISMPSGYRIPPHSHPVDEATKVIEGSLLVSMGDKFDASHAQRLVPGDSVLAPPGARHSIRAEQETLVEVSFMGPYIITYVHEYDLPRRSILPFGN